MLIWFWMKFRQTSKVFLRAYISRTKFSDVLLTAHISLIKSHVYFGYNILCTENDVYKFFVRIFVRKLVMYSLDVTRLVTDGSDVSNNKDMPLLLIPAQLCVHLTLIQNALKYR